MAEEEKKVEAKKKAPAKKATKKAAKQQIRKTTATIDFDNMGPEIVRKDGSDTKREDQ